MKQRQRIRPRIAPRRKRPEIFHPSPAVEGWPAISLRKRQEWWAEAIAKYEPLRCGICNKPITYFDDLVPDHIEPGKMGGCKDNSDSNIQPAHWLCNQEKGSKRNYKPEAAVSAS